MSRLFREPERDLELGNALRQLEATVNPDDAEPLRRRIAAAARSKLGRLSSPTPRWWEWISAWNRVALPVGLAASLAAGLLLQGIGTTPMLSTSTTDIGSDSTLVLAAFSESPSGGQLTAQLIAPEGEDWLLQQAVGE